MAEGARSPICQRTVVSTYYKCPASRLRIDPLQETFFIQQVLDYCAGFLAHDILTLCDAREGE